VESSASTGHEIMYLGIREVRRPKGPAKLREILEKREAVLNKWRDGTISARDILRARIMIFSTIIYIHVSRVIVEVKHDCEEQIETKSFHRQNVKVKK